MVGVERVQSWVVRCVASQVCFKAEQPSGVDGSAEEQWQEDRMMEPGGDQLTRLVVRLSKKAKNKSSVPWRKAHQQHGLSPYRKQQSFAGGRLIPEWRALTSGPGGYY